MEPDSAAHDRMLQAILKKNRERRESAERNAKRRRAAIPAAACLVVAAAAVTASRTGLLKPAAGPAPVPSGAPIASSAPSASTAPMPPETPRITTGPSSSPALSPSPEPTREPEDRTVWLEGIDPEGKEATQTWEGAPDLGTGYLTPESLVPDSQLIVLGTVTRVTCTDVDGDAVTLYDMELEEVWLDDHASGGGALIPGDRITVLQPGGYIRGDVFSAGRGGRPG